jgi:hypothetical protein
MALLRFVLFSDFVALALDTLHYLTQQFIAEALQKNSEQRICLKERVSKVLLDSPSRLGNLAEISVTYSHLSLS